MSSHDLKPLLEAGLHFGHKTAKWNPKMAPFLFGKRAGIHVFDLTQTAERLESAMKFLETAAAEGKTIMLVSTKHQSVARVQEIASELGLPFVTTKWFGGMLTNWKTTKQRLKHLRDLKSERDANDFAKYLKKERNQKMKEIARLEEWFSGMENLEKKPDVVFVLDTVRDRLPVTEANLCKIPTVGVADSNADPSILTHAIPANDDAVSAVDYILDAVKNAVSTGQKKAK